ncbi:SPOR domain-containing protein [Sphingomonas sp. 28-62-11]|uniref:SPOR domain-containing protein n=1 Tax=Sphingomonas sp. 28-62-11 TaxID=1970432 RepID=UPI0035A923A8
MIKRRAMISTAAMALAAIGMVAISAPARADVKSGVDAWSRGEYKKAVENWRPLAIAGDADAQFNLGQAYKLGRGVPVDLALAEEWYRKAAFQGHLQAEDSYGLTLFQNNKRDEAVRWLERSAGRGEPRAQLVLGTMFFNGDAVKKDWVRAYALVTRAAASGLPQGGQTLGQMDQYIPADVRQQGIALARDYEAAAERPRDVPEVAGQGSSGLRGTELPASTFAEGGEARPALNATKAPTKPIKPPVVAKAPAPAITPAQVAPAVPRPVSGKGWRVQFGAFRDEGNARGLWQQLQAKVGGMNALQPIYARVGTLTKLQAGPLASSADAAQLCRAVSAKAPGTPCVPVAP